MNRKFSAIKQAFKDALKRTKKPKEIQQDKPDVIYTKWVDFDGQEHIDEEQCTYVQAYTVKNAVTADDIKTKAKAKVTEETINGAQHKVLYVPGDIVKVGSSVVIAGNLSSSNFVRVDKLEALDIFGSAVNLEIAFGCFKNAKENLTKIPTDLFRNCSKLTICKETFANTAITFIPPSLFENCPNLTSVSGCFSDCTNLKYLTFDIFEKNHNIRNFEDCFARTAIKAIPSKFFDSVKGEKVNLDYTFQNCSNLIDLPIPLFAILGDTSSIKHVFSGTPIVDEYKKDPGFYKGEVFSSYLPARRRSWDDVASALGLSADFKPGRRAAK